MNRRSDSIMIGLGAALLLALSAPAGAQEEAAASREAQIAQVQAAIKANGAKWVAGETTLSRLSGDEWGLRVGLSLEPIDAPPMPVRMTEALPARIDWRDHNGSYVTGIRDQKTCGSCWAFAMTGALESNVLLARHEPGKDLDLAEQVLVSCSWVGSCKGGLLIPHFLKTKGLPPESDYPYSASDGSCASAAPGWKDRAVRIGSWGLVSRKLAALKAALVQYGPLPTAFMVHEDFMHYKSGVYSYVSGKKLGGHAVLLVGYDDAEKCFIVKNSWGPGWGEAGFFRIAYSEMETAVGFGKMTVAYKSPQARKAEVLSWGPTVDAGAKLEALEPLLQGKP